jgi:ectoine hydroxylase-related dioxygenase (phytanoyl-CoA dioxygenase family)
MVGFIFMVDPFRPENGATRFVPGSHRRPVVPGGAGPDLKAGDEDEVPAYGPAGSVIAYNGSVWHGHGANRSAGPRRSIQGAYLRRDAEPVVDPAGRMSPETYSRLGRVAKYLLGLV